MIMAHSNYWAALQATPNQNIEAASSVQQKRQNGRRVRFLVPLPCVIAKLLIFEGKGWVISDKNYGKKTKTIMLEHQTANYS